MFDDQWNIDYNLEFAAKMKNLANLIQQNPGFNWSTWSPGQISVQSAEEMAEVVRRLGRGKWKKESTDYSFSCVLQSPDNAHFDIRVQADHAAVCEKVGEEPVEKTVEIDEATIAAVKAGESQIVTTKMKPIWKCPTSILAVAPDIPADLLES